MSLLSNAKELIKKFKSNVTDQEVNEISNCGQTNLDDKDIVAENNKINKDDNVETRKNKLTNQLSSCSKGMRAEDLDGNLGDQFDEPPCSDSALRLGLEDVSNSAGTGIDESVPAQEGFIPPPCYDYANEILNAVNKNTLNGGNGTYNPNAILMDKIVNELRDFHEVSKFMFTIQDDSEVSKELIKNTAENPKYNQIFMNKDVQDFRDVILNKKVKNG